MTSSTSEPLSAPPRYAIIVISFAFLVTMMGTTLPTPLYSIYSTELEFSPLTVTVLFAVYAFGVVGALLLFGRLSDDLGRRPVLMIATGLALLSALLFLLPPSFPSLIVARLISGVGAGFMSGAGTAAIIDLFPAAKKAVAGTLAVTVNTGGLALGTLIAGILATVAPLPLATPFAVHLVLCIVALIGLTAWAPVPAVRSRFRIRAHRLNVPPSIRGAFIRGVLAAGAGFAVTGVLTAVSALFLAKDLHLESHLLAGSVVFLTFASMAVGQLLAQRMQPRSALPIGCAGLVVASAALALALASATLTPLIVATITLGLSGGLCLNAGIATTIGRVPPEHRGEVSSSFFAGLYLMLAIPAIGVGLLASFIGLRQAGLVFTAVAATLTIVIGIAELVNTRRISG